MKKLIGIMILSVSVYASGGKVWKPGNDLVKSGIEIDGGKIPLHKTVGFINYVMGVTDALSADNKLCAPKDIKFGQLMAVVKKYMENNPDRWAQKGFKLTATPLLEAFPCKR